MTAVQAESPQVVQMLLDAGARLDHPDVLSASDAVKKRKESRAKKVDAAATKHKVC